MLLFSINPHWGVPVYRQIMDHVRYHLAAGTLAPGHQLPSIREGDHVPTGFEIPGELRRRIEGPVLTAVVRLTRDDQLDHLRAHENLRVQEHPLGLSPSAARGDPRVSVFSAPRPGLCRLARGSGPHRDRDGSHHGRTTRLLARQSTGRLPEA
jgi:hypothetical protein